MANSSDQIEEFLRGIFVRCMWLHIPQGYFRKVHVITFIHAEGENFFKKGRAISRPFDAT